MNEKNKTQQILSICLSLEELWHLINIYSPGVIFGVPNPFDGLSERNVQELEIQTQKKLLKTGILQKNEANQYVIDEMIGGMVYSCIHSKDMLTVKDQISGNVNYYHFLPNWQLELSSVENEYKLTIFKNRSDLFQYILSFNGHGFEYRIRNNCKFSIAERDFEMVAFLYETGKPKKALQIFNESCNTHLDNAEKFLSQYSTPNKGYIFDMFYSYNDPIRSHQRQNMLYQLGEELYWVTKDYAGEDAQSILLFETINLINAKEKFQQLLPKDLVKK